MSFFTQIIPAFTHPGSSLLTQGGGIISAIAAAEMGIRAVGNLFQELSGHGSQENRKNFSKNSGGAVLYATLSLNIIPGTAFLGGAILTGYTLYNSKREFKDSYLFSYLTGGVLYRFCVHVLDPVARKVWDVVGEILLSLGRVLDRLFNAIIPRDPIWIGVTALFSVIILYKGSIVIGRFVASAAKGILY